MATDNKAGVNHIKIGPKGFNQINNFIKKIKMNVDCLIVSIHWGGNWVEHPSKTFQEFAHKLIDAGVDIIHRHSPHIF